MCKSLKTCSRHFTAPSFSWWIMGETTWACCLAQRFNSTAALKSTCEINLTAPLWLFTAGLLLRAVVCFFLINNVAVFLYFQHELLVSDFAWRRRVGFAHDDVSTAKCAFMCFMCFCARVPSLRWRQWIHYRWIAVKNLPGDIKQLTIHWKLASSSLLCQWEASHNGLTNSYWYKLRFLSSTN